MQNCPSADSQTNAIETLIQENEEQNDTNNNIQSNEEITESDEKVVESNPIPIVIPLPNVKDLPKEETVQKANIVVSSAINTEVVSIPSTPMMSTVISPEK